jgi:hypothetical protein
LTSVELQFKILLFRLLLIMLILDNATTVCMLIWTSKQKSNFKTNMEAIWSSETPEIFSLLQEVGVHMETTENMYMYLYADFMILVTFWS